MKRTTAISLLLLLLASQYGHHVLYSLQDLTIRHEQEKRILSNIPEKFLDRFEDSPTLSWEEPGKEFMMDGRMYDVVRSRVENGKTVHYAIADGKESELVRAFSKILRIDPNGPQTPQDSKSLLKIQIPVFTVPEVFENVVRSTDRPKFGIALVGRTISRPRSVLPCPPWA